MDHQTPITLLKTSLFVVLASLILLTGCSHTSETEDAGGMVFQGEGEKWEVSIPGEVILRNGRKVLPTIFRFKGDPEELKEVESISFALGTARGTQIINVYDPAHKERLMETGGYQEEYEDPYGIIVDEIKNRNTNVFRVGYVLEDEQTGDDPLDSIKERVMILIRWKDRDNQWNDRIVSTANG